MASSRAGVSRSRSTTVALVPAASALATSSALAARILGVGRAAGRPRPPARRPSPPWTPWRRAAGRLGPAAQLGDRRRWPWAASLGFDLVMGSLRAEVDAFIDDVSTVLVGLGTGRPPRGRPRAAPPRLRHRGLRDRCAVLASDGRQTDDELWELSRRSAPPRTQLGGRPPPDVRRSDVIDRFRHRIESPSEMFRLLLDVDRARGTGHARTYYDRALAVAFSVAATDIQTSEVEVKAIEAWLAQLLGAATTTGPVRSRPGHPPPSTHQRSRRRPSSHPSHWRTSSPSSMP